jgi:hypothetical protein
MKEERLMKVSKIVAGLAAATMLAAMSSQTVLAADTITIKADEVAAAAGENFTLNISLDGVPAQGISVMEFAVKYDSKAVENVKVSAGAIAKNGVDDVEKFEGATAFVADTSTAGLITITYSTSQTDAKYCVSADGVYATITGTVKAGTADGSYPVEIVAIDRETKEGSGTKNTDIKAGYIDADQKGTLYATKVVNGAVVVGGNVDPTSDPGKVVYGDVDESGKVDIIDVITLNKNLMVGEALTAQGKINADVDKNGSVDEVDSLNILKYVVEIVTELPV